MRAKVHQITNKTNQKTNTHQSIQTMRKGNDQKQDRGNDHIEWDITLFQFWTNMDRINDCATSDHHKRIE